MRLRRTVYLLHRYLGIALCLLVAMWFASGMVLMYVGYPSLDEQRRLAGLPELGPGPYVAPGAIIARYPDADVVRLNAATGRAAYRIRTGRDWHVLDAFSGRPLEPGIAAVRAAARRYAGAEVAGIQRLQVDQWTVSGRLNAHRPLLRARMNDARGTWLYLSTRTGEVVQEASRGERLWNRVGAVPHWIYPWQLRRHPELWRNVVIGLSLAALVLTVTGALVGVWRLRVRRRYKGNRMTPYRGWQRWHHLLGVACTGFVFTFLVSGLLSLNPGGIFSASVPEPGQRKAWAGEPPVAGGAATPAALLRGRNDVRELEWIRNAGTPLVLLHGTAGTRVRHAAGGPPGFRKSELVRRANRLLPDASVADTRTLQDYDAYYYDRSRALPLPVLRIRFDDSAATTLYVDPATGSLESRIDRSGRWRRWLYNGLHSLDFPLLWEHRPLRDAMMLGLCLAGFAFSMTGVVIGWRRLNRGRRTRVTGRS